MLRWEYCVVAPAPSGPQIITITCYTPSGAQVDQRRADEYDEAVRVLWPQVIAQLGRAGWELVAVEQDAWHFKRPLSEDQSESKSS